MTTRNLRSEIQKALDNVPENVLEDVLTYLQEVQKHSPSEDKKAQHLREILSEDSEVLKKLAQ